MYVRALERAVWLRHVVKHGTMEVYVMCAVRVMTTMLEDKGFTRAAHGLADGIPTLGHNRVMFSIDQRHVNPFG